MQTGGLLQRGKSPEVSRHSAPAHGIYGSVLPSSMQKIKSNNLPKSTKDVSYSGLNMEPAKEKRTQKPIWICALRITRVVEGPSILRLAALLLLLVIW
jgi:hypothetical protein